MIAKTIAYENEAFCLENENISCTVIPTAGAKIVSLLDKRSRREWLVAPMHPVQAEELFSNFTEKAMGGWDEMLPTVDACSWEGINLPDHGELWQVPWSFELSEDAISTWVRCVCFPFSFSRKISLVSDDSFLFEYQLKNEGEQQMPWIWAAHPQFAMNADTRFVLPEDVKQLVNIVIDDPVFGPAGTIVDFPVCDSLKGGLRRVDTVGPASLKSCRKFYCQPDRGIDHAGFVDEKAKSSLQLHWDADIIPYCGLWVDEGAFHAHPVAAIEPISGYYDNLTIASKNQRLPYLAPGETIAWTLSVRLSPISSN